MKITNNIDVSKLEGSRDAMYAALPDAAKLVLADSTRRVPYEKGDLSRSGRIAKVNQYTVSVRYDHPGAVDAHERLEIPAGRGRERKYLENAFNATRAEVLAALVAAGKRALR